MNKLLPPLPNLGIFSGKTRVSRQDKLIKAKFQRGHGKINWKFMNQHIYILNMNGYTNFFYVKTMEKLSVPVLSSPCR